MVGMGGLLAALFVLSIKYGVQLNLWLFLVICVGGVLGSMRLLLGQHTLAQVYAGFLMGFITIFTIVLL